MKTLLLSIILCSLTAGFALGVEDIPQREKPPAHLSTDDEIEAAVTKGIVANPEVFAARLQADSVAGIVTLRGSVQNLQSKALAEKITLKVPGVRGVRNKLVVRPPARK